MVAGIFLKKDSSQNVQWSQKFIQYLQKRLNVHLHLQNPKQKQKRRELGDFHSFWKDEIIKTNYEIYISIKGLLIQFILINECSPFVFLFRVGIGVYINVRVDDFSKMYIYNIMGVTCRAGTVYDPNNTIKYWFSIRSFFCFYFPVFDILLIYISPVIYDCCRIINWSQCYIM